MEKRDIPNIVLYGVQIKFRNLRGEAGRYNHAGERSFSVVLPDAEFAEKLKEDGWNAKSRVINQDGDVEWILPVAVAYRNREGKPVRNPPRVYLYADGVKTELGEEDVNQVDFADIQSVDLTIRPYEWETVSGHGIKAYLKNMYVTVVVDELERKWARIESDEEDDDEELPF